MKKTLFIAVILLVVLLGGVVVAPGFVDWDRYKPQIVEQISQVTGYDVTLGGALDFAVLPSPRLLVEDVKVSLPRDEARTNAQPYEILTLERMEVALVLRDLFEKRVTVDQVLLLNPRIVLRVGADGAPLWMPPVLADKDKAAAVKAVKAVGEANGVTPASVGAGLGDSVSLQSLKIKGGALFYQDAQGHNLQQLDGVNLDVAADSLMGPYALKGQITYQGQDIALDVNVGARAAGDDNLSVQAQVKVPGLKSAGRYAGIVTLSEGEAQGDVQGELSFTASDLALWNDFAAGAGLPAGPLALDGFLTGQGGKAWALKDMKLSWGGATMVGKGAFILDEKKKARLDVALESKDILDLSPVFLAQQKEQKQGSGQAGVTGATAPTEKAVVLLPESINLPFDLGGAVTLKLGGVRYDKAVFEHFDMNMARTGNNFAGHVQAQVPGGGQVALSPSLAFGSSSVSAQDGQVIFSDPVLALDVKGAVKDPASLLLLLAPAQQAKDLLPFVPDDVALDMTAKIRPQALEVSAGTFEAEGDRLSFSGRYDPPGQARARGKVTTALSGEAIDIVAWQKRLTVAAEKSGHSTPAVGGGAPDTKLTAQEASWVQPLKDLSLPWDVDVTAVFNKVILPTVGAADIQLKGGLAGDRLQLTVFDVKTAGGDHMALAGTVGALSSLDGIDMKSSLDTPDLEKLMATLGLQDKVTLPSRVGAASMVAAANGRAALVNFTVNAKALGGTLEVGGAAARVTAAEPQLDELTLRLRHPRYSEVVRVFKPDFNSAVTMRQDLDVFAQVKRTGDVYDVSDLKAKIGPSTINGTVKADMSAAQPQISAVLQMGDVPLDQLLGQDSAKKGVVRASSGGGTASGKAASGGDQARWSRTALDMGWMRDFDLDVKATASSLSYGGWLMSNADIAAQLKKGVLTLDHLRGGLYDGTLLLNGQAKAGATERDPLAVEGAAQLDNVALESFVQAFSGEKLVKARGKISLKTQMAARGLSPAALIYDLRGSGSSAGQDLLFEGFDLARLSRALAAPTSSFTENFGKVLDATTKGGSTSFDTLDAAFTVTEGVVTFDKLALDGPDALVTGTGNVNLPLWTIDLKTIVDLKEPEDAPSLETTFKGPLDNPGKTFGQNAMQQYFSKQIQGMVLNPLLNKLQEKGVLQAPTGNTSNSNAQGESSSSSPAQTTPEDALFGILQGVLGGQ